MATAPKAAAKAAVTTARLRAQYTGKIVPELEKELQLPNVHQVPRLEKIVVNVGLGRAKEDKKVMDAATNTLRKITGQQPVDRIAKKSIATFKIRRGMNRVGVSVTLRGKLMYEFADRLINVVLPRVRDFHGVPAKAFDKAGNYSLGLIEQSVFPELGFEETQTLHGLQINFVIKSEDSAHSRALLTAFGMPFEKEEKR